MYAKKLAALTKHSCHSGRKWDPQIEIFAVQVNHNGVGCAAARQTGRKWLHGPKAASGMPFQLHAPNRRVTLPTEAHTRTHKSLLHKLQRC